jgi:hypothetical protein
MIAAQEHSFQPTAHKEDLLNEIQHQLTLGPEGLLEEDRFLLECNFDKLTSTTGKQQEYWRLAIQVACEASCLHAEAMAAQQCPSKGIT